MAKTALYRHFDAQGQLLYVGISLSFAARLAQHMSGSRWAGEIATATVKYFPTREAAESAERYAITTELPLWNTTHHPRYAAKKEPAETTALRKAERAEEKERLRIHGESLDDAAIQLATEQIAGLLNDLIAAADRIVLLGNHTASATLVFCGDSQKLEAISEGIFEHGYESVGHLAMTRIFTDRCSRALESGKSDYTMSMHMLEGTWSKFFAKAAASFSTVQPPIEGWTLPLSQDGEAWARGIAERLAPRWEEIWPGLGR